MVNRFYFSSPKREVNKRICILSEWDVYCNSWSDFSHVSRFPDTGEKEVREYYGRGSSCSISRQAGEQEILAVFQESHISQDCQFKRSQAFSKVWALSPSALWSEEEPMELYPRLCFPWAKKKMPKHLEAQEHHGLFGYSLCSSVDWSCWNESADLLGRYPDEEPSCLVRVAFRKKTQSHLSLPQTLWDVSLHQMNR